MLHDDRNRAESFGADAEQYDRARPSYPAALIDALVADNPAAVLDVGCGTGIASRLLAERGCDVLGVEPDSRMAALARAHRTDVELATFEAWDPEGRRFDLLVSAQAWHWVEPAMAAAKAASVLTEHGRIGLFWNRGHPPDELKPELERAYSRHAPGLERYSVLLGNSEDRFSATADSLLATERFDNVELRTFGNAVEYTTEQWLDHLPTHSDHRVLEAEARGRLLDAIAEVIDRAGGAFTMTYESVLVTGRRRGSGSWHT